MTSAPFDPPEELDLFAAIHRKAAQQAAVAELGRRALTGVRSGELFGEAVASAHEALGTERVAVLLPDETGALVCVANVGWRDEEMRHVPPTDDSQVGFTYIHGEPLVVVDYAQDERWPGSKHLLTLGIAAGITVPVRGEDGQPVGVLVAHGSAARRFSDDDVLFLRGIANVLAATMAREVADDARLRSEERLAFLADASDRLSGSLDEREVLAALAELAVPVVADRFGLLLAREHSTWPAALDRDALASGTPLVLAGTDPELAAVAGGSAAVVALPLVVDGQLHGVALLARRDASLDGRDLELLADLARRASLALENAVAHEAERRARAQAESLQRVTARLAATATPDDVFATVLEEVVDVTGAASGLVAVLEEDGETIRVVAWRGFETAPIEQWRTFPLSGPFPVSDAIRRGEAVYCETLAQRNEEYPVFADIQLHAHALIALPLTTAAGALGAITLSYPDERPFDATERSFLETIARQCAQALERTRLRAELTRERALFEAVLRNMPSAVVVGELPGLQIVLGNDQVAHLWRRPLDDVRAEDRYDTFTAYHLDGRPFAREDWPLPRLAATGEPIEGELMAIERADGTRGFVSVSAALIRDEHAEPRYGVVVLNDVTDETNARREAERRADASRALEFVGDGVCLVDANGTIRLWNRAAARMTGLGIGRVAGRALADVLPGWTDVEQRVPIVPAGSDRSARATTLPFELGDRELWLSISGVSFADGTVYAFRDVTEEHQLERMKSDFIATVSHELRTPLAAIYGAATTLRQRPGLEPEQREAFLGMVEEQAERLTQIVTDILTASRAEAGELGVELTPVEPGPVVEQVVELASRTAPGRPIAAEVASETPRVLADADRLRQVLGNVVENALKYSPDEEGVALRVFPRDGRVVFEVEDRGPGIPADDEERIFQKFVRLDANMRSGVSGTGLGLYICRELVSRMDGSIAVEPRAEGGSRFTVELPAA